MASEPRRAPWVRPGSSGWLFFARSPFAPPKTAEPIPAATPPTEPRAANGEATPSLRWKHTPWRQRDVADIIACLLGADSSRGTYEAAAEAGLSRQEWYDFLEEHGRALWEANLLKLGHRPPRDLGPQIRATASNAVQGYETFTDGYTGKKCAQVPI